VIELALSAFRRGAPAALAELDQWCSVDGAVARTCLRV